jgi:hypothetical protein
MERGAESAIDLLAPASLAPAYQFVNGLVFVD